jgi:hypothetical protein
MELQIIVFKTLKTWFIISLDIPSVAVLKLYDFFCVNFNVMSTCLV